MLLSLLHPTFNQANKDNNGRSFHINLAILLFELYESFFFLDQVCACKAWFPLGIILRHSIKHPIYGNQSFCISSRNRGHIFERLREGVLDPGFEPTASWLRGHAFYHCATAVFGLFEKSVFFHFWRQGLTKEIPSGICHLKADTVAFKLYAEFDHDNKHLL